MGTGKLPGLFGGHDSACGDAAGVRTVGCWTARLAWHSPGTGAPAPCVGGKCAGEIYLQTGCQAGGGHLDVSRGSWSFTADGNWHSIEEFVSTAGQGSLSLWYDGTQAINAAPIGCSGNDPVGGLSFTTFYGGDTTSYGPSKATDSYFASFMTSTKKL